MTISTSADNDTIENYIAATYTLIDAGAGNNSIDNSGASVSIDGGKGSDLISIGGAAFGNVIEYDDGDGNDEIYGCNSSSTIRLSDGASYSALLRTRM